VPSLILSCNYLTISFYYKLSASATRFNSSYFLTCSSSFLFLSSNPDILRLSWLFFSSSFDDCWNLCLTYSNSCCIVFILASCFFVKVSFSYYKTSYFLVISCNYKVCEFKTCDYLSNVCLAKAAYSRLLEFTASNYYFDCCEDSWYCLICSVRDLMILPWLFSFSVPYS